MSNYLARGAQQYRDTNGTLPSGQDLQDIGNRAMLESYGTTDRSAIPAKSANPAKSGGLSGVFSNIGSFISDTLMPSADAAEVPAERKRPSGAQAPAAPPAEGAAATGGPSLSFPMPPPGQEAVTQPPAKDAGAGRGTDTGAAPPPPKATSETPPPSAGFPVALPPAPPASAPSAPPTAGDTQAQAAGTQAPAASQGAPQSAPAADSAPGPAPVPADVARGLDVLKDPGNAPGYGQWLAGAAKTDPQWAEQHGKALIREQGKTDLRIADTLASHAAQAGLDLYAKGHQADTGVENILAQATANGGWLATGGDKTVNDGKECVALVKATVPEFRDVSTRQWTRGEDIKGLGDPPLKPGTALASGWDKNGDYPSNSRGNHALIYGGPDPHNPGKVIVLDQFGPRGGADGGKPRDGQPVQKHSYRPEDLRGYSVIRLK